MLIVWAVVAVVLVVAVAGLLLLGRSWPQTRGTVRITGLGAPVEVLRDGHGVPHIYAASTGDLMFAQGFVHAQDRFFQMDLQRRAGLGRLSELFGKGAVPIDAMNRKLGMHLGAARDLEALDVEARAALVAYSAGVNACLDSGRRPLEYRLLRVRPQKWEPLHSLAFAKMMQWELNNDWHKVIVRERIVERIGAERTAELYPDFEQHPGVHGKLIDGVSPTGILSWPAIAERLLPASSGQTGGEGLGTNVWTVGPQRAAHGKPVLANDTHLALGMPGVWYENGLHSPDLNCVGVSMPGVFGVVVGHNERIAWGMATLRTRVQDLYVERPSAENPDDYHTPAGVEPFGSREEVINVRGADEPVRFTFRTTRHGAVITDGEDGSKAVRNGGMVVTQTTGPDGDEGERLTDRVLSLKWQATAEPSTLVNSLLPLNRAANWQDFTGALRSWDSPTMTFMYADVDGNIGSQVAGRVPIRASGAVTTALPGWEDGHEWIGTIPFDELPRGYNPPSGMLVAANSKPIGPGYPYFLAPEWCTFSREIRILELLEELPAASADDMPGIQLDTLSVAARRIAPFFVTGPVTDPAAAEAQRLLRGWDHRMSASSVAAAVYVTALRSLVEDLLADHLDEDLIELYLTREHQYTSFVDHLLDRPDDAWWGGSQEAVVSAALTRAVRQLAAEHGPDSTRWAWGRLHSTTFRHPVYSRLPLLRRFGQAVFGATGGDPQTPMATSFGRSLHVSSGPVHRHVVDLADWESYRGMTAVGQSGHLFHPHYKDQLADWGSGDLHRLPWQRDEVLRNTKRSLRLVP